MLPASQRLRSTESFGRVMKLGTKKGSATVVAYVMFHVKHQDSLPPVVYGGPRVGLVVSKAVGNAVVRHRTSRKLRHAAAEVMRELDVPQEVSIVLRALPSSGSAKYQELVKDVRSCIRRALP